MAAVRTPTAPVGHGSRKPNPRGVPQGLAISNYLAELVMQEIDNELAANDCFYARYVDDILILCHSTDVNRMVALAEKVFPAAGLVIHRPSRMGSKSSTGSIEAGFSYLGYIFRPPTISVRDQSIRNVENSIARIFTRYKYDRDLHVLRNRLNLVITGCIYGGNSFGWLHYFRQMNDLTLLKRLDAFVGEMKKRSKTPAGFKTKNFMRAYWSITHPYGKDGSYIPNFDTSDTFEMRSVLAAYLGEDELAKISDSEIGAVFKRVMQKLTVDLEKDIGHLS